MSCSLNVILLVSIEDRKSAGKFIHFAPTSQFSSYFTFLPVESREAVETTLRKHFAGKESCHQHQASISKSLKTSSRGSFLNSASIYAEYSISSRQLSKVFSVKSHLKLAYFSLDWAFPITGDQHLSIQ